MTSRPADGGLICHFTDSPGFGGAERAMLMLAAELRERGAMQTVMFSGHVSPGLVQATEALGVSVEQAPSLPLGLRGALRVPALAERLRRRRPQVFHAHLTWPLACKWGLAAALAARVPAVVATEQLMLDFPLTSATRVQQRALHHGIDRYIAVSEHVADSLVGLGWPATKTVVIPNAVDLARFEQPAASLPADRSARLLTVARLDPQKGHRHLLDALVGLPHVTADLVGHGPLRAELEHQADRLGLGDRVAFLGDRSDISALLRDSDIFVLPSLYEGLPLSLLEAMAARRPIVATDIGGTREIIRHEDTGLLVAPAAPSSLAEGIRRMIADAPLRADLVTRAHALVHAHFGKERMAADTARLYGEALRGKVRDH